LSPQTFRAENGFTLQPWAPRTPLPIDGRPRESDYVPAFIRKPENGNRYGFVFGIDQEGMIGAARIRIYR